MTRSRSLRAQQTTPSEEQALEIMRGAPGVVCKYKTHVCIIDDGTEASADALWDICASDFDTPEARPPITVSLLDIARPAKIKGIAKNFEVVERAQHVIALEDFEEGPDLLDDDWEKVYDEDRHLDERKSYSAVLRGKEG